MSKPHNGTVGSAPFPDEPVRGVKGTTVPFRVQGSALPGSGAEPQRCRATEP